MKIYKNIRILKKDSLLSLNFFISNNILLFSTMKGIVVNKFPIVQHLKSLDSSLFLFFSNKSSLKQVKNLFTLFLDGLAKGFFFELSLRGIGFKCYYFDNNKLFLSLGYSHYIIYTLPYGVVVFLKKGKIFLYTLSKELLGNVVSDLKNLRMPDAYKAKGIVDSNKIFNLKEGKKR
jgi:ribosomal protein L6P/L9E